ncbi:MAG: CorA family divalent cation transporter [bacterium]|nr:CorA family divalent cation transporter [bacterium]
MIFRHEYLDGVWVDIEQPSADDIQEITREFSISERLERELLSPTSVPTVADDEGMALLVLHFPTQGVADGETKIQEIDFVVGKKFILTVRYEIVAPLHHLKKLLEAQELVNGKSSITTDVLLEVLFAHLYTSMRDHTNHIANNLERVEKEMFDGRERTTVRSISNISREFLHMEAALANQEESLGHFLDALDQYKFFGPSFAERSARIQGERTHVSRIVKTHRAIATEMRETNIAILGARQNEIMKTLTIVNFIFLPLGLISWTFSMRTEGMPIIDSPNAFWIVLSIMMVVTLLLTTFFIKRRWL